MDKIFLGASFIVASYGYYKYHTEGKSKQLFLALGFLMFTLDKFLNIFYKDIKYGQYIMPTLKFLGYAFILYSIYVKSLGNIMDEILGKYDNCQITALCQG